MVNIKFYHNFNNLKKWVVRYNFFCLKNSEVIKSATKKILLETDSYFSAKILFNN